MVFRRRSRDAGTRAGADTPEGYTDLEVVDRGGFAVVYRARDERFDRTVALKVLGTDALDDRALRRFRAECMATGRVSAHPNIVTVYDAGTTPSHRPWLAMEYCSGGSLADQLEAHGPMPVDRVLDTGIKLAGALQAAHSAGILHRDVKPQNVLVTDYREPALADFGIALVTSDGDSMTQTAAFTVVHSAPEILEGDDATPASDVYSLASTLYALLAGRAAYATEASIGLAPLVTRILRGDVPALDRTDLPDGFEAVLRQAMSARLADRPRNAAELAGALADLASRAGHAGTVPLPGAGPVASPAPEHADDDPPAGADVRAGQVVGHLRSAGVADPQTTHAVGSAGRPHAAGLPAPGTQPTSLTGAVPPPVGAAELTHRRADLPDLATGARGTSDPGTAPGPVGATGSGGSRKAAVALLGVVGVVAAAGVAAGVVWGLGSAGTSPAPVPSPTVSRDASSLPADEAAARAPRDVVVEGGDGGRLDVSWTLPDRTVLPLLQLEPPAPPEAQRPVITQGDEQVSYSGLEPGTTYCVTVIGFTKQGDQISTGRGEGARDCGTPR